MKIKVIEHGRQVSIDVSPDGVSVAVGPDFAAGGPIPFPVTGQRAPARCPSCGEHHDPKEHAGGDESPATADGYPLAENLRPYLPTDLRPKTWRCVGCGSASDEQHAIDCEEYRKSEGGKRS